VRRYPDGVVITERDRAIFGEIFENRVMYGKQLSDSHFPGLAPQRARRRLCKLESLGYIERRYVYGPHESAHAAYSLTPKALKAITDTYRHKITREFVKSDSVAHDLMLVEVRRRLERLKLVTRYYTENMLQACAEFSEREALWPFVQNNTDAVLEVTRQGAKTLVALEWENSEKAQERYTRKLVSYYSDARTPAVFYVCANARIRAAVAQAEAAVGGKGPPRCFYSLIEDVLSESPSCTFTDRKGAKIVLS
jgi:hypothetical protein